MTLQESAQKWYYHYPPEKLPTYQLTKKAFLLRFRDEKIDEDILCELGRSKQKDKTIKRYDENFKDLTKQLEVQPSDKNLRAWFLNGSSNKRLKRAEITNATNSFEDLVARALNMDSGQKKQQKRSSEDNDSSRSSSSGSDDSTDYNRKKKR